MVFLRNDYGCSCTFLRRDAIKTRSCHTIDAAISSQISFSLSFTQPCQSPFFLHTQNKNAGSIQRIDICWTISQFSFLTWCTFAGETDQIFLAPSSLYFNTRNFFKPDRSLPSCFDSFTLLRAFGEDGTIGTENELLTLSSQSQGEEVDHTYSPHGCQLTQ